MRSRVSKSMGVALVGAVIGSTALAGPLKSGDPMPDLNSFGVTGNIPADLDGKVVLLDFWASWCAPCKASFEAFSRLHAKYSTKGLVILAVSVDQKPADMAKFLKKSPVPFPTLHDARQKLVERCMIDTMPTSYLIDRQGRIRYVHSGFHGKTSEAELTRQIEELLR